MDAYTAMSGPLNNAGSMTINAYTLLTSDLTNTGAIEVAGGAQLELDGRYSSVDLVQSGGTLSADGLVKLDGGRLDYLAGAINSSGTFQARNAVLNIDAGVTAASTIQVIGGSNVLLDNASPAVTLWVAGDDVGDNQGVLTAVPGAINAGTIELQSLGAHWDSFLAIDDTLANTATGVIEANAGAGNLPAGLINEGLLAVAADNPIEVHGSYVAAGGQITGPGSLYSVAQSITAATATPTMLVLHGSSTLLTDNLADMTLWLRGQAGGEDARSSAMSHDSRVAVASGEVRGRPGAGKRMWDAKSGARSSISSLAVSGTDQRNSCAGACRSRLPGVEPPSLASQGRELEGQV